MTQTSADGAPKLKFIDVCRRCQEVFTELAKGELIEQPPVLVHGWLIPYIIELHGGPAKIDIDLQQGHWNAKFLWGYYLRKGRVITIRAAKSLPSDLRRYVTVKELSHLLLDCPHHHTGDAVTLIENLIINVPEDARTSELESEQMAMYAATELLVPWKFRNHLENFQKEGFSHKKIAEKFKVPEKVITGMLGEYGAWSRSVNQQVEAENAEKAAAAKPGS